MITIPYSDANISKVGRFLPDNSGIQSGWQGSQLRFKVQGTAQIILTAYCYDPIVEGAQWLGIGANVDQGDTIVLPLETDAESFTGTRSVTLTLPDTGLHTIILKLADKAPWHMWDESTIIRLTQMEIDDGGEILPWVQDGATKLMIVGDSWSGAWLDWPRLLPSQFSIYPVAYGGATADDLDTRFPYNKQGLVETDPDVAAVIVTPGVNDYNAGVSGASFQASVLSLVDKIRSTQATAKIFLLQAPRNGSLHYDQYGTNLQAVASLRSNVYYISTASIWSSLSWVDTAHLAFSSRQTYATFVASQLPDVTIPTVTDFTIPATSTSLTVPITALTATDDTAVTGYKITESSTAPLASDAGWSSTPQTEYTFGSAGAKTLWAWAKDSAGNVSAGVSADVVITVGTTDTSIKHIDGTQAGAIKYVNGSASGAIKRKVGGSWQ